VPPLIGEERGRAGRGREKWEGGGKGRRRREGRGGERKGREGEKEEIWGFDLPVQLGG